MCGQISEMNRLAIALLLVVTEFAFASSVSSSAASVSVYSVLTTSDASHSVLASIDPTTGLATVLADVSNYGGPMNQMVALGGSLFYNAVNMTSTLNDVVHLNKKGALLNLLETPRLLTSMTYSCNDANAPVFLFSSVDIKTHNADVVTGTYVAGSAGPPLLQIVFENKKNSVMYGIGSSAFSCKQSTLFLPVTRNNNLFLQFLKRSIPPATGWHVTFELPLGALSPDGMVVDEANQLLYFNMFNSTTQTQQLNALSLLPPFHSTIVYSTPVTEGLSQATGAITFSPLTSTVIVALADGGNAPWILAYQTNTKQVSLNQFAFKDGGAMDMFPACMAAAQ